MARRPLQTILKGLLWVAGGLAIAVAAILGVNAIDESLSTEAKALLNIPQPPAASERNGYVDRLGLGAPEGETPYAAGLKVLAALRAQDQPGFKRTPEWEAAYKLGTVEIDKRVRTYAPGVKSFLELAAGMPELAQLIAKYDVPLARYRAMREKPEYVDLYYPARLESSSPAGILNLQHLVLLSAAAKANAGNLEGAVRELELENAFQRKAAAASPTLLQKMIAVASLQRNALFISDLVRTNAKSIAPFLPRLEALVHPLSAAEADMAKVLRMDAGSWASVLQKSDALVPLIPDMGRHWWNGMIPLFYRPGETVNLFAARSALLRKVADVPAPQYLKAADEAMRQARALAPQGPANYIVNPVGRGALDTFSESEAFDNLPYIARVHDTQGLYALVALQLKLRAAGAVKPEAIAAALAGPLGTTRLDPYTEKPMTYDPKTNSLGYESQSKPGTDLEALKKRFGGRGRCALAPAL
jgi:hypothetical protein